MTRACKNCQWWGHFSGDTIIEGLAECRGAPPAPRPIPNTTSYPGRAFPFTAADDWCGAFRMAERLAGGITDAEFEDAHKRMAERLQGIGRKKETEQ